MDELPWPFIGSQALADKAIPERAMRKWYQPVYPDVYVPHGYGRVAGPSSQDNRRQRCSARNGSTRASLPSWSQRTAVRHH
jgi:hypothetical protein